MSVPSLGALLALVAALGVAIGNVTGTRARWDAGLALASVALALVAALSALPHPALLLSSPSPAGSVIYALDTWSGFWAAVSEALLLLVGGQFWATFAPKGQWLSLSWLAVALLALFAAKTPLSLFVAWGVLALAVYGLVVAWAKARRTVQAAWTMLAVTEVGAALLFVAALLLSARTSFAPATMVAASLLGLVGLGAKAGLFPFQLWLPVAEPEAPGAAAGLLSGVVTSASLLSVWRWFTWAPPTAALGWAMVVAGLGGSLLGAVHALLDEDHKRVLAYSTSEWIGAAVAALGLFVLLRLARLPVAAGLAEGGFFLLLLVHMGAKTALFTTSDWVERTTQSRDLNALGGLFLRAGVLAKAVLWPTAALMALPPSGGYLAQWLLLESLFYGAGTSLRLSLLWLVIPLAVSAAAGATALLRWYGSLFLGPPRAEAVSPPATADVAVVAAGACLAWGSGLGAGWLLPFFQRTAPRVLGFSPPDLVAPTFTHPASTSALNALGGRLFAGLPGTPGAVVFPGHGFSATSPLDLAAVALALVVAVSLLRRLWLARLLQVRRADPWTGGPPYQVNNAWTADGLTQPLRLAFAPVVRLERTRAATPEGHLLVGSDVADRLVRDVFRPLLASYLRAARRLKALQARDVRTYVGVMLWLFLALLVAARLLGV